MASLSFVDLFFSRLGEHIDITFDSGTWLYGHKYSRKFQLSIVHVDRQNDRFSAYIISKATRPSLNEPDLDHGMVTRTAKAESIRDVIEGAAKCAAPEWFEKYPSATFQILNL